MIREDTLRGILRTKFDKLIQSINVLDQIKADIDQIKADIDQIKADIDQIKKNPPYSEGKSNLELYNTTLEATRALLEWIHAQQQSSAALGQTAPPPVVLPAAEEQTERGSQAFHGNPSSQ